MVKGGNNNNRKAPQVHSSKRPVSSASNPQQAVPSPGSVAGRAITNGQLTASDQFLEELCLKHLYGLERHEEARLYEEDRAIKAAFQRAISRYGQPLCEESARRVREAVKEAYHKEREAQLMQYVPPVIHAQYVAPPQPAAAPMGPSYMPPTAHYVSPHPQPSSPMEHLHQHQHHQMLMQHPSPAGPYGHTAAPHHSAPQLVMVSGGGGGGPMLVDPMQPSSFVQHQHQDVYAPSEGAHMAPPAPQADGLAEAAAATSEVDEAPVTAVEAAPTSATGAGAEVPEGQPCSVPEVGDEAPTSVVDETATVSANTKRPREDDGEAEDETVDAAPPVAEEPSAPVACPQPTSAPMTSGAVPPPASEPAVVPAAPSAPAAAAAIVAAPASYAPIEAPPQQHHAQYLPPRPQQQQQQYQPQQYYAPAPHAMPGDATAYHPTAFAYAAYQPHFGAPYAPQPTYYSAAPYPGAVQQVYAPHPQQPFVHPRPQQQQQQQQAMAGGMAYARPLTPPSSAPPPTAGDGAGVAYGGLQYAQHQAPQQAEVRRETPPPPPAAKERKRVRIEVEDDGVLNEHWPTGDRLAHPEYHTLPYNWRSKGHAVAVLEALAKRVTPKASHNMDSIKAMLETVKTAVEYFTLYPETCTQVTEECSADTKAAAYDLAYRILCLMCWCQFPFLGVNAVTAIVHDALEPQRSKGYYGWQAAGYVQAKHAAVKALAQKDEEDHGARRSSKPNGGGKSERSSRGDRSEGSSRKSSSSSGGNNSASNRQRGMDHRRDIYVDDRHSSHANSNNAAGNNGGGHRAAQVTYQAPQHSSAPLPPPTSAAPAAGFRYVRPAE